MLNGFIKPIVIKIFRNRLRYRRWGLPLMKPLRVIGYDMRHLLVTDERVVRVYKVLWKDINLVDSERVMQVPIVQTIDRSRVIQRNRERNSLFKSKRKPKES
jgi:hypothetical protein